MMALIIFFWPGIVLVLAVAATFFNLSLWIVIPLWIATGVAFTVGSAIASLLGGWRM